MLNLRLPTLVSQFISMVSDPQIELLLIVL